jgi:hypothetical protein
MLLLMGDVAASGCSSCNLAAAMNPPAAQPAVCTDRAPPMHDTSKALIVPGVEITIVLRLFTLSKVSWSSIGLRVTRVLPSFFFTFSSSNFSFNRPCRMWGHHKQQKAGEGVLKGCLGSGLPGMVWRGSSGRHP